MAIKLKPLNEQRIIITGATSGIGLATADAAVGAGARVMLAARDEEALAGICENLSNRGGDVAGLALDTADPDYATALAAAAVQHFGGFDTWVNNAAAATYGTLSETPIADQRRVFDVGYWGTVNGALVALAHMRERGSTGAIINLGSVLCERAMILQGPYSAMKHAVKGFSDALRSEILYDGLPVSLTLIKPSAMNTPYPAHARNRMREPARLPPLLHDPRLAARAILFAAAHQRRELTVGGFGVAGVLGNLLFPGLLGRVMAAFDEQDKPYAPRDDGRIESNRDHAGRRQSLWPGAQRRPDAALGLAGIGAGALGLGVSGLRRKGAR